MSGSSMTFGRTRKMERFILLIIAINIMTMIAACVTLSGKPVRVTVPCSDQLWETSLVVLNQQVGVREATGNNDGPMVRQYLRSVSLSEGNPWCQALQYWTFLVASRTLNVATFPCIPIHRTGSTMLAFREAKRIGRETFFRPQIGDLIYWFVPNKWQGHVGRIVKVLPGGWVQTKEGNTGNGKGGSEREGNGCYERLRNWAHPLGRMLLGGLVGHHSWEC